MMYSIKILLGLWGFAALAFFSETKSNEKITVVIDAGHGGKDFGATFEPYSEKQIVADISRKIKAANSNVNLEIILTRDSDFDLPLSKRAEQINGIKPDLLLSLHVNQNKNQLARGTEFYVAKEHTDKSTSRKIAEKLEAKLKGVSSIQSRGIKEAPFMILKNTEAPAVLVELGFLSNFQDRAYLTDNSQQDEIVVAILDCLSNLKQ